jgi:alkylation response protein AidB-like acyl-CoA dehydrogenase
MDFNFTEDQILLKEMIYDFAQKEIKPLVHSMEESCKFPHELFKKMGSLGILGMSVPSEYGGEKTDSISMVLILEELGGVFPSLAVVVSVHCSLFCYSITTYGTESQKRKYLPKAARGEILGAFSLTEPGAGSDATNLKTKAVKQGDHYILNGTKSWITSGGDADALILFAQTEKDGRKKGLSAFIADIDTPGLKVSKIEEKMGLHASLTAEIVLEDCKIPEENLLGEEGQGIYIALHCLDNSRIGIAAQSVGLSKRALDEAVQYAKQREAFNRKISDFQAIQFMIADMATRLEAARLLTYNAADQADKKKKFSKESAMAKLYASEAANQIVYQALQIHGGYGYSREFFIEQLYRDARVLSIYEGTSEIQRIVISRQLLEEYE